ncbi:cytochrome P450 [Microdochium trichocladiopsis]|uniref:Cytochrome P450 n=1 Tax=Microdochium trichocladiopsis TaxID=1682393 RepID=A0A9P8Y160_9PEZI|nr:cytochrome P450 [Microdochium trichocladiopsis]KAH7025664.1 cytochrome P450 [Microdochium trichocladiopsis]
MDPNMLFTDKMQLLVPIGALLVGAMVIVPWLSPGSASTEFPLAGEELGTSEKRRKHFIRSAVQMHADAYKKVREVIVLPISYVEELRNMPDTIINNVEALNETLQTHYTGLNSYNPLMNHVIRSDLTHNLPRINHLLSKEVAQTVPEYLGKHREWTRVNINEKLLKMVAIISGHVFIGPQLNRDERYLDASINYTVDLFKAAGELQKWHRLIRPIGKYFIPSVHQLHEQRRRAKEFLVPVVQKRRALREAGEEVPDDMLQWMIAKADKFNVSDDGDIAETQLTLSLAAIHTTTLTATHVMYDLIGNCAEVIPEIRKEIATVMAENDNVMTTQALYEMKLLDSAMRESQRMNTTGPTRFQRRVKKDVRLSDGTLLPAGSNISVPHTETLSDAAIYSEPHKFNPYRFYDIRAGKVEDPLNYTNKEQYQFISVSKENMGFGYGRHACPGRFFAANEIKLMLARILLDYDIKMPDGVRGRYPNIVRVSAVLPDPTKEIMFNYVGEE